MKKCIIKYNEFQYNCWCNYSDMCSNCSVNENRKDEKECSVAPGGFCTCRLCGERNKKE